MLVRLVEVAKVMWGWLRRPVNAVLAIGGIAVLASFGSYIAHLSAPWLGFFAFGISLLVMAIIVQVRDAFAFQVEARLVPGLLELVVTNTGTRDSEFEVQITAIETSPAPTPGIPVPWHLQWRYGDPKTHRLAVTRTGGVGVVELATWDANKERVGPEGLSPSTLHIAKPGGTLSVSFACDCGDASHYRTEARIRLRVDKLTPHSHKQPVLVVVSATDGLLAAKLLPADS